MNQKSLTTPSSSVSHSRADGDGAARVQEESPYTLSFSPQEQKHDAKNPVSLHRNAAAARAGVRTIYACERHSSRSLLALGNCAMYCTNSCMLRDTQDDIETI
jgi:hypothetical protein